MWEAAVTGESLAGRDLLSLLDFTTDELERILELAAEVKANPLHFAGALAGKTLFMYFEKPSLRTRVTFEAGMTQLGWVATRSTTPRPTARSACARASRTSRATSSAGSTRRCAARSATSWSRSWPTSPRSR